MSFICRFLDRNTKKNVDCPKNDDSDSFEESEHENEDRSNSRLQDSQKKKYVQRYRHKWAKKFGSWLVTNNEKKILCKACNLVIAGGISHVERHSKTFKHKRLLKASETNMKLEDVLASSKELRIKNIVKSAEVLLVVFLAEHNLAFLLLDHLVKLVKAVCPDSEIAKQIKMNRKKGTLLCKTVIAKEQVTLITKDLNESHFSLIIDESTDVSISKSLVLVVRYYKDNSVYERFLGLIEMKESSSESIFKSIVEFFNENEINIQNLMGFAADNCNVMMGNINGVQAKFKSIVPHVFVLGCVCHSFSLCSSAACTRLPKSLEQLVRDICNYFSNSSARLLLLKECQAFLNLEPHKMLRLSQTRWLSLQAVIDRILEQYEALILFFTNESFVKDNIQHPDMILSALKNPVFKLYFLFLSYVLEMVNKLNLEFQSESIKLHVLSDRVTALYKTIIRNFLKKEVILGNDLNDINVKNPDHFLELDKIHFGAKCELYILQNTIEPNDLKSFKVHALDFYIELSSQIKKRFTFNDPVLNNLKILDPNVIFSDDPGSVIPLVHRFPNLCDYGNIEKLDIEYRLLQECENIERFKEENVLDFWNLVLNRKNDLNEIMFPNLKKFISGLLCLPHSSAAAERIFSKLNSIKTKLRNRLLIDSCNSLLHTQEILRGDCCYNFKPGPSLLNRKINYSLETNEEDHLIF